MGMDIHNQTLGGYMKISKTKLEILYSSKLSKDVCEELKISHPTLRKLLRKAGIPLKGQGNHQPRSKIILV